MKRPHCKAVPVPDDDHIGKTLEGALHIIFGFAGVSRTMIDHQFANMEATHLEQCWNKPVHLTVEADVFKTFFPVDLQGATAVMDAVLDQHGAAAD